MLTVGQSVLTRGSAAWYLNPLGSTMLRNGAVGFRDLRACPASSRESDEVRPQGCVNALLTDDAPWTLLARCVAVRLENAVNQKI